MSGEALRPDQRRMALLALLTCAWLLGVSVLGAADALGYLAPTLALVCLLAFGRYPGERVFERRLAASGRVRPARPRRSRPLLHAVRLLPRGGVLLAAGLAGRAPPPLVG